MPRYLLVTLLAVLLLTASRAVGLHAGGRAASWTAAASMSGPRANHAATLLPSGKVLVTGGEDSTSYLVRAELYDPIGNAWSSAGSMSTGGYKGMATLLANGKVLVINGSTRPEMYDPATNGWSSAGTMTAARGGHTATLLQNGKVLVAGGGGATPTSSTSELYDPTSNSWSSAGNLHAPRTGHTATLLPNGKVIIVGGTNAGSCPNLLTVYASTELYDPGTSTWTSGPSMANARQNHTATLLSGSKLLVVGGWNFSPHCSAANTLASAELYDPTANAWSSAAGMSTARWSHAATLLSGGGVLAAGGYDGTNYLTSAEQYDPGTNSWSGAGTMNGARRDHTATLLPSGNVLIAGGFDGTNYLSSAELYGSVSAAPPILAPALSAVADGGEALFFGRSPQSELWFRETSGGTFGNWTRLAVSGVASRPRAVMVAGDPYVFFRASTNELHYFNRTNGLFGPVWGSEQNLGGLISGSPTAAVDGNGTLIVGVLNSAGSVFVNRLPSGGPWTGFQPLDGILSGRLEMVSYNGDVYLFGINGGGVLWQRQWNHASTTWSPWTALDGVLTSAPAAAVSSTSLYVLAINPDCVLWYRALSGGTWGVWTALDGVLSGDPAAAATTSTLLAFGTNPAGALFDRRQSGGSFGAWDQLDGVLVTGPVAVTVGTQTYVFAINGAGNTWYRVWNGTAFGAWQNLGGILATE